jgi:peptidoglycan/xylan/chitin deacetylase (PgdA/CDA1 family)
MKPLSAVVLSSLLVLASPSAANPVPQNDRKQIVIISFDGAHDNALWEKSRAIATRTGARFTYFLSCTFLMTKQSGRGYSAPHQHAGRSNVGFAPSDQDVQTRLNEIWLARGEGHEIASHGCGHFDGKSWSPSDWRHEFSSFTDALTSAWARSGAAKSEPEGWRNFARKDIRGFRAPYLSTNAAMYSALANAGFSYDASGISRGPVAPGKDDGLTTFSLPLIPEGPRQRRIIAMDYNLFVRHSGGFENPSNSKEFEDRSYDAFRQAFDAQYRGKRLPLQFGFHFVEMNGGAYWRAMERLATDVCTLADVACVTYGDAMHMLEQAKDGSGA